jgi:two-component system OmpR family response regulator
MARHILVVDDDGDVRDIVILMLQENGFLATAATGGVAMRELLAADGTRFDAIVLDSLMPGEQGPALALHAKTLQIPVIMISGSRDSMKFAEENGLQLLRKPFRMAELIQAVEDALASGQFGQRDA